MDPQPRSFRNDSDRSQGPNGALGGTLHSSARRDIMMHLHSPSSLAVPGIGFPQNISIGPHLEPFRDRSRPVQERKTDDAVLQLITPWRSPSWTWFLSPRRWAN